MYVFLSRTATGSSARFAAAAAATYLRLAAERRAAVAAAQPLGLSPKAASTGALAAHAAQQLEEGAEYLSPSKRMRLSGGGLLRVESDAADVARCAAALLGRL
jgi:hypothetical protein